MKVKITDAHLRAMRKNPPPSGKNRMDYDTDMRGFAVRITSSGAISFLLCYAVHGVERRHVIGRWSGLSVSSLGSDGDGGMTVQAARQRAAQLRRQVDAVKEGDEKAQDPAIRKIESAREMRYRELAERYLEEHASQKKDGGSEDGRRLRKYVLPHWKDRKAKDIARADVDALISPIKKHAPYEANRVLALVSVVFSFALDKEIIDHHPCLRMKSLKSKESVRERALETAREFRIFWRITSAEGVWKRILRKREADYLRLVMLTGARRGEIAAMEWAEIDWHARLWKLPAERSKNGQTLTLPITDAMLTILQPLYDRQQELPEHQRNRYVFEGRRGSPCDAKKVGRKLATICQRLERIGFERFTIHDLRRTVETGMAAARVPKEYRDRVLNHKDTSVGGRNYNKHDYLDQQQEALDKWARLLESRLTSGPSSNVVPLRKAG